MPQGDSWLLVMHVLRYSETHTQQSVIQEYTNITSCYRVLIKKYSISKTKTAASWHEYHPQVFIIHNISDENYTEYD